MSTPRKIRRGALLLLASLLLAGCAAGPVGLSGGGPSGLTAGPAGSTPAPPVGAIRGGAPAPDFELIDLTGQPVSLASLRGQGIWINFWATWCPSCKTEMPRMAQKYQQYRDQGLVILSIDLQESPDTIRAWAQGRFSWRFLLDSAGKVADLYRVEGLPTHVFVDRLGVIRTVASGELSAGQMDAAIAPLLAR